MSRPQPTTLDLPKRLSPDYEKIIWQTEESALCAASIKHFATQYVYIQNQNTRKVEKWQPWPYLLDLIDIINNNDLIYILKASQLGISWLMAIFNEWTALFNETSKCLLISQGQTEAYDLLSKVGFIHANLPDFLKVQIDRSNRESLVFGKSEIRALPSTDKAGHGYQASLVTRDEVARHEFARDNFRAVSRAIDSGGKLVELSTANKKDVNNYFGEKTLEIYNSSTKQVLPSGVEVYTDPARPKTCLVFLTWKLRPVRYEGLTLEEWWNSRILPRYTLEEIEEQYPETAEDVFKPSLVRAYFDSQSLEDMGYDCCSPIKQSQIDTCNGMIRVYKLPDKSRHYIIFTDPSDGSVDPFVTGVMDYVTGEVVCSATGKVKVDHAAGTHDYLVRTYNNASNSYEYNAVGMAFGQCLDNLQTPNQSPRRKTDGKADFEKKGQYVSGKMKQLMFADLAHSVAKRQVIIHDREFSQQAKLVQRDELGFPETSTRLSFDWVMMMNGLCQLSKYAPKVRFKAVTIRS